MLRQASEHQAAMDRQKVESRRKVAELEARNHDLERELKSVREKFFAIEASMSGAREETVSLKEKLRHVENEAVRVGQLCSRVDEVLIPELSSCLMTLNNIESEMAFMLAHSIRATPKVATRNATYLKVIILLFSTRAVNNT